MTRAMATIESVLAWAEAHPRTIAAIDRADRMLGRPLARLAEWDMRRSSLRMQIRACGGGKAPWYEGEAALRARLDRLARTGRA